MTRFWLMLLWKRVITSKRRQYSICLVLTALWMDLAVSYSVGVIAVDGRSGYAVSHSAQSGSSGVGRGYIVSASQPEHGWLATRQRPPSYSTATHGDVGNHHTFPPMCFLSLR